VTAALLALAVALLPVRTAETVPPGRLALHLDGGFAIVRLGLPVLPVLPVLSGDAEIAYGVTRGVDVRLHYMTHLGLVHRIGPELRLRLFGSERGAFGVRVMPSVRFVGAAQEGVDYAGDISTQAAVLGTLRGRLGALTAEAGLTAQWILYQSITGMRHIDDRPYLAYLDFALEWEKPLGPSSNFTLRLEVSVSRTPDDPFGIYQMYPRIVAGGNFGL